MLFLLALTTIFLPIIIGLLFLRRFDKRAEQRKIDWFKEWGLKFGFSHTVEKSLAVKFNRLRGFVANHAVVIYEHLTGHRNPRTNSTTVIFKPNPFDFDFQIGREGVFEKLGKAFKGDDIQIGNENLDKQFLFRSNNHDQLKALMNLSMQEELTKAQAVFRGQIESNREYFLYSMADVCKNKRGQEEFGKMMEFVFALVSVNEKSN